MRPCDGVRSCPGLRRVQATVAGVAATLHRDARAAYPDRHHRDARGSAQRAHIGAPGGDARPHGRSHRPRGRWQDGTDARAHGPSRRRRCRCHAASDCRLALSIPHGTPASRRCRRGDHRLRSPGRRRGRAAAGRDRRCLHGRHEVRRDRAGGPHVGRELPHPRVRLPPLPVVSHRRVLDGQRVSARARGARVARRGSAGPGRRVRDELPRPRAHIRVLQQPRSTPVTLFG